MKAILQAGSREYEIHRDGTVYWRKPAGRRGAIQCIRVTDPVVLSQVQRAWDAKIEERRRKRARVDELVRGARKVDRET